MMDDMFISINQINTLSKIQEYYLDLNHMEGHISIVQHLSKV